MAGKSNKNTDTRTEIVQLLRQSARRIFYVAAFLTFLILVVGIYRWSQGGKYDVFVFVVHTIFTGIAGSLKLTERFASVALGTDEALLEPKTTESRNRKNPQRQREKNTVSNNVLFFLIIGWLLQSIVIFATLWLPTPPPRLAYEIVLDVSSNMQQEIDGIPASEIALDAVRAIVNRPAYNVSGQWAALRTVGGGTACGQTELTFSGAATSTEQVGNALSHIQFGGKTGYQQGLRATISDLNQRTPRQSEIRIVYMIVGSIQQDEDCTVEQDIADLMIDFKLHNISTTMCLFSFVSLTEREEAAFNVLQDRLLSEAGITCAHNFDEADAAVQIAAGVIRDLVTKYHSDNDISLEQEEEGILTPVPFEPPNAAFLSGGDVVATASGTQTGSEQGEATAESTTEVTPTPTATTENTRFRIGDTLCIGETGGVTLQTEPSSTSPANLGRLSRATQILITGSAILETVSDTQTQWWWPISSSQSGGWSMEEWLVDCSEVASPTPRPQRTPYP